MGKRRRRRRNRNRSRDKRFAAAAAGYGLWDKMTAENVELYVALRAELDQVYIATRALNDAQPLRRLRATGGLRPSEKAIEMIGRAIAALWPVFQRIEQTPHRTFPACLTFAPRREDAAHRPGGPAPPFHRPIAYRAAA